MSVKTTGDDVPTRPGPPPEFLLQLTSHQSTLYAAITALLGGVAGAQDVLQETNLVLLQKADGYDLTRPFAPWAMTFAHFQVLAWRKRQSRDRLVLDEAVVTMLADRLTARPPSPNMPLDALEKCLTRLPEASRGLVDARYLHEEPVQAIAERLGLSAGAVSVALFRIRKALRDCVRATLASEGGL